MECSGWSFFILVELLYQLFPFDKTVLQHFSSKSAFGSTVRKNKGKEMEYATFVFDSMCTKCKKPSITVLREQKVVLCVVGEEVYKALLFVAGLVFCYSPFWLVFD